MQLPHSNVAKLATLEWGSCTIILLVPVFGTTVLCTPDDGCERHPKHVEWSCSKIKYSLHIVASRWTFSNICQIRVRLVVTRNSHVTESGLEMVRIALAEMVHKAKPQAVDHINITTHCSNKKSNVTELLNWRACDKEFSVYCRQARKVVKKKKKIKESKVYRPDDDEDDDDDDDIRNNCSRRKLKQGVTASPHPLLLATSL